MDKTDESPVVTLTTYDDVDELLTSALSDEEKLDYLKGERERIKEVMEYVDFSITNFNTSDVYLKHMKAYFEELKKSLKKEIPLAALSGTLGIFSAYQFIKYVQSVDANLVNAIFSMGISAVLLSIFCYYTKNSLDDGEQYINYSRQLKKYNNEKTK